MPVIAVVNAARIATALYTIVVAAAMTYYVVQGVSEDRKQKVLSKNRIS